MHIIMAVLSLGLLIWAGSASAQLGTHTASVSVHRDLPPLSSEEVRKILDDASRALAKVVEKIPGDQACPVTFKLKGPVRTFGSDGTPSVITTEPQRDAVHRVDTEKNTSFHIKVVKEIHFCVGSRKFSDGCAWPVRYPSIIVVHPSEHKDDNGQPVSGYPDHLLWVHEFGHLTGRSHRPDPDKNLLMTGCRLTTSNNKVSGEECGCLVLGPRGCGTPTPAACQQ